MPCFDNGALLKVQKSLVGQNDTILSSKPTLLCKNYFESLLTIQELFVFIFLLRDIFLSQFTVTPRFIAGNRRFRIMATPDNELKTFK